MRSRARNCAQVRPGAHKCVHMRSNALKCAQVCPSALKLVDERVNAHKFAEVRPNVIKFAQVRSSASEVRALGRFCEHVAAREHMWAHLGADELNEFAKKRRSMLFTNRMWATPLSAKGLGMFGRSLEQSLKHKLLKHNLFYFSIRMFLTKWKKKQWVCI